MNWGNAEAVKTAKDKMKNTLLAAFIILAAYFLVGALIGAFSGNSFQTFIKDQNGKWNVGPKCEGGDRPKTVQTYDSGTSNASGLVNDGGCGADLGKICSCEKDADGCNCGGIANNNGQCNDASLKLEEVLGCIKRIVTNEAASITLRITSISDSHGLAFCRSSYPGQCPEGSNNAANCCYHEPQSCHYGGGTDIFGSHAADFGIDSIYPMQEEKFRGIVERCGGYLNPEVLNQSGGVKSNAHYHVAAGCSKGY